MPAAVQPQMSVPEIVLLEPQHIAEVCRLEKLCYSSPWCDELIADEFTKRVSFRPGLLLDGRLVGYSFSYWIADEMHLLNLAVHPDYRCLGLGKRLLSYVLYAAAIGGIKKVTLEVRQGNTAARRLYEGLGFECAGIRENYYQDNCENAIVLCREVLRDEAERLLVLWQ